MHNNWIKKTHVEVVIKKHERKSDWQGKVCVFTSFWLVDSFIHINKLKKQTWDTKFFPLLHKLNIINPLQWFFRLRLRIWAGPYSGFGPDLRVRSATYTISPTWNLGIASWGLNTKFSICNLTFPATTPLNMSN